MGGPLSETIEEARSMGTEFRIVGQRKIKVRGLSLLPTEMQDILRENKAQVFEYLESETLKRVPPIIWETGNVPQINSLLALREAELLLAKSQLTGKPNIDWYINNRIRDLEIKISDMKRWQKEAEGGESMIPVTRNPEGAMGEELAVYLQDMEAFLTPKEYQDFLKAKEVVERYFKEADDYVERGKADRRLAAEYQEKIGNTENHFEQSRLQTEIIRLTVGNVWLHYPHKPGYQFEEHDRYIRLARDRKANHLQEQERIKAVVEAERRREERQRQKDIQRKMAAASAWKSFIDGFYRTIEELKNRLSGSKPASLPLHCSLEVFKYNPSGWCELALPGDKDIRAWARPQVLEKIPQVLTPFVSIEITPKLVVVPRIEYQSLGCPCLTWHFDIYATASADLLLKESTIAREFNGWEYSASLKATKLGTMYLGYCLWDSQEGFSTPLALLRLMVSKDSEGPGIEVLNQDSEHTVYIVDGYEESFAEVRKGFVDYIRAVGSKQPLVQALLTQGLIDVDTAKLIEAKWDEPLPVTVKVTTASGPDLAAVTAKLMELGWAEPDAKQAVEALQIPGNAALDDIIKTILEKSHGEYA